ncbi:NAD-dependent epimerase/dehydratase family protein [Cyclobacterium marinum]|uniref:NAD-dependent epimerase/dehydratase n=2 Tax=Cyclobacterium marinum TaxID=104 RepID=G0J5B6_CYCMS|nr:NAD-dependent epimerase/dehydratase family protein [Cyclobacterium marinum]AEL27552.1 NAD-dependent epimerase/dehydratase [Cyclobacterium marinum DSM 745]
MTLKRKKVLAIAGATGYIGRWFMDRFKDYYHIIGLSRKEVVENPLKEIEWRQVELYSISSTTEALQGVDYAIYLVHSMNATTRLNQGSFEDTDLLLADNFARAATANAVEQIIYLGGILPKGEPEEEWSLHLKSRLEVEKTLSTGSAALTALRASIIVGPGGSSFDMIKNLVKKLPVMVCPKWTESNTQPISLRDTLTIIDSCLGNEAVYDKAIEIGNPEVMSYKEMLIRTSKVMGKKRWIFSVPFFSPGLSKLWVGYFGESPSQLVSPLVESLKHTMTVSQELSFKQKNISYQSYDEAVKIALQSKEEPVLPKFRSLKTQKNTVRSIQRMANLRGRSAFWAANRYKVWLPTFFKSIIKAKEDEKKVISFYLFSIKKPMLQLSWVKDRSDKKRQLFYITGGYLVSRANYGWLEFREVLDGKYIISAIHEFVPKIPWLIYVNTQARLHLWVMNRYAKYLNAVGRRKSTVK